MTVKTLLEQSGVVMCVREMIMVCASVPVLCTTFKHALLTPVCDCANLWVV